MNKTFIALFISLFVLTQHTPIEARESNGIPFDIIIGIVEGLTPADQSGLCIAGFKNIQDNIIPIVQNFVDAIKDGESVLSAILDALGHIKALITLGSDCRIPDLISAVKHVFSDDGPASLIERVSKNLSKILPEVEKIITNVNNKKKQATAKALGVILRYILDFYVK